MSDTWLVDDDWQPEWLEETGGFEIVDELKDEYHERVFQYLQREHGWGHSGQTRNIPGLGRVEELVANTEAGPHTSRFWIVNVDGGVRTFVVGSGTKNPVDINLWIAASEDARSNIGRYEAITWTAHLAQLPAEPIYRRYRLSSEFVLSENTVLSPVRGVATTEMMAFVGQAMAGEHVTALIRVDGSVQAYAWPLHGQTRASGELRIIAALISLAWESPWFLRDGPTDRSMTWDGAPGPVSGTHYRWIDDDSDYLVPPPRPLPHWFAAAHSAVLDATQARAAVTPQLLMHHEGVMVMREHPSLALLAFVAVIESLANPADGGKAARFKAAVRSVLPAEEAAYLERAYKIRSRTVHDAALHGREFLSGGWGLMSVYVSDPLAHFESGTVQAAQAASKAMILNALGLGTGQSSGRL